MTGPGPHPAHPLPGHDVWPVRSLEFLGDEIWLVLGGGGIRGVSHAGAWQALLEAGVPVKGIVGTSIGGLIGACIAGGMTWERLAQLSFSLKKPDIVRLNRGVIWVNGIKEESVFKGSTLLEYIDRVLPVPDWDDLKMPIQINAVDLATGEEQWFGTGARSDIPLVQACYASAALAVLYPPARVGGQVLVDGGVANALPCQRAADLGASGIIAVDVGSGRDADADTIVEQGLIAIHNRVFSIMSARQRVEQVEHWDGPPLLYVRPQVDEHSTFAFDQVKYFLEEGYRAMRAVLTTG
jgi:NTE family protein